MAHRAKIFKNGGSQAIRLPKAVSFPEGLREVAVRKVGRRLIVEPADEWSQEFLKLLGTWKEPVERPPSRRGSEMKDPFE